MKQKHVAHNYAAGLFHASQSNKSVEAVENDLGQLAAAAAETGLVELWQNPQVPKDAKHKMADEMLKGAQPFLINCVHLLIERNRAKYIPDIYQHFLKISDQESDSLHVTVQTAFELSATVQNKISKRINELTGRDVRLSIEENASLIGGIRLKIQDNLIDGSVLAQLDGLRQQLVGSAN